MKTVFTLLTAIVLFTLLMNNVMGQTNTFPSTGAAGIGTTTPNASSLLEIKSTTQGFLPPRMTLAQRNAVVTPAKGLLIYQTNNTPGFYYFDTTWKAVTPTAVSSANLTLSNLTKPTQINTGLHPMFNDSLNLGTRTNWWKNLYVHYLNFSDNTVQSTAYIPYTAGTGISIASNIITNSKPDKTVVLTAGTGISVTGTYPSFTISNTGSGVGGWALTGNSGTNAATNFIGTTDAQPLVFKVNNVKAGYIDYNVAKGNTSFGYLGLFSNTTGVDNTAHGMYALYLNQAGLQNTATGFASLYSNTIGNYNSAHGVGALNSNIDGLWNTASGAYAMYHNTSGSYNTATGGYALQNNLSGNNNVANGFNALNSNTTGYSNVAMGIGALYSNTFESNSVAVGDSALYNYGGGAILVDIFGNNTAIGSKALFSNVSGGFNTATGSGTLYHSTLGSYNTANGYQALYYTDGGGANVANGYQALYYNGTGGFNTANGNQALYSNTTGGSNTANGNQALYSNTTGGSNTANGNQALYSNTIGYSNVAVGTSALYENTDRSNLVAIGDSALFNNGVGATIYAHAVGNTGVGSKALYANTKGWWNTANGFEALYFNTTGSINTANGYHALYSNTTGGDNTALGDFADVATGGLGNATAIGKGALVDASNKVRIGDVYVTNIGGQVSWSTFSDGRYKKNIKEDVKGLSFINSLKPITYTVDINGLNTYYDKNRQHDSAYEKMKKDMVPSADEASKIVYNGFIAQDVEAAAKKMNYEFSGVDKPKTKDGLYGLRYSDFVVPLVKAVQELSAANDAKDTKIDEQEKKIDEQDKKIDEQQQMISSLVSRLDKLEQSITTIQQCSPCAGIGSSSLQTNNAIITDAASLQQNVPNPFSNSTSIGYTLPQKFTNAQIVITDKLGKTLKAVSVSGSGKGSLNVDAAALAAGAYQYSLMIDGRLVDTKQMMLVR